MMAAEADSDPPDVMKADTESSDDPDLQQRKNEDARKMIEQLRTHLEQSQRVEDLENAQAERTQGFQRNVIIRVDRKDPRTTRLPRADPVQSFSPTVIFTNLGECCAEIQLISTSVSGETRSITKSIDTRQTNSFLHSGSSESESNFVTDAESQFVTDAATLSQDSFDVDQQQKKLLRLKSDILSDGSSVGEYETTFDRASTDCTETFTDEGSCGASTFSARANPLMSAFAGSRSPGNGESNPIFSRKDAEVEEEGKEPYGDDEMDEEQENDGDDEDDDDDNDSDSATKIDAQDVIDNVAVAHADEKVQRIFIVRSEFSRSGNTSFADETFNSETMSNPEPPRIVLSGGGNQCSSSSTLMVSSATFSHDEGEDVEQFEQINPCEDEPGRDRDSTNDELGDVGGVEIETKLVCSEENSLPLYQDDGAYFTPREPEMDKALENIGKALEEASLIASLNKETPKHPEGEQFLVASGTSSGDTVSALPQHGGSSALVTRLYKIPFIHGSFAAAAPFIMHDLKWKRILRKLMPDAHAKAVAQMQNTSSEEAFRIAQMMKWAENNPVVAAYGILTNGYTHVSAPETEISTMATPMASNKVRPAKDFKSAGTIKKDGIPPLEWNVFLDPLIVSQLDKALHCLGRTDSNQTKVEAQSLVQRHVSRLVKRMVLAHGSTSQLFSEALGAHRAYTFASIVQDLESVHASQHNKKYATRQQPGLKRASATTTDEGGVRGATGIFVSKWLATFASALHLGESIKRNTGSTVATDNDVSIISFDATDEIMQLEQPLCGLGLLLGFSDKNSVRTYPSKKCFGGSPKYIAKMLGGPLRVVLNLRSRHVPGRVWAQIVDYLRQNEIFVESVASFDYRELRSIGSYVSAPVKQFRFFHSLGDLQKACHADEIKDGDYVFFNAASLISTDQDPLNVLVCGVDEFNDEVVFAEYACPKDTVAATERKCKATIEDYKRKYRLNIGCYIQEHSVSKESIDRLVDFFNRNSSIYNLGLAYGGINGKIVSGLKGDGFTKQRFMGRQWDENAKPLYEMQLLAPWHSQTVQKAMGAGLWGQLGTVNDGGRSSYACFQG